MIEDYSFGSKGRVFNLAENCGLLKYMLFKKGYRFFTVPPTVVKKFATGKGNANKEAMVKAAQEKYGYPGTDDNVADALHIWHLAEKTFNN